MKPSKKSQKRLAARINDWMRTINDLKPGQDPRAYRKPGSMKRK